MCRLFISVIVYLIWCDVLVGVYCLFIQVFGLFGHLLVCLGGLFWVVVSYAFCFGCLLITDLVFIVEDEFACCIALLFRCLKFDLLVNLLVGILLIYVGVRLIVLGVVIVCVVFVRDIGLFAFCDVSVSLFVRCLLIVDCCWLGFSGCLL